jgi:hypothetical protein
MVKIIAIFSIPLDLQVIYPEPWIVCHLRNL